MRQSLDPKKLRRYSREHGMTFVRGLVRGSTGHRVDLYDEQGRHWYRWPDGRLEAGGEGWHCSGGVERPRRDAVGELCAAALAERRMGELRDALQVLDQVSGIVDRSALERVSNDISAAIGEVRDLADDHYDAARELMEDGDVRREVLEMLGSGDSE